MEESLVCPYEGFRDFLPREHLQDSFPAVFSHSSSLGFVAEDARYCPCNIVGVLRVDVMTSLFRTT